MDGDGHWVQPAAAGERRAPTDPVVPMDPAGPHYRRSLCGIAGAAARSDRPAVAAGRFRGE